MITYTEQTEEFKIYAQQRGLIRQKTSWMHDVI